MLPKIARQTSSWSARSRGLLVLCALALFALPTFHQEARSQFGGGGGGLGGGPPKPDPEALAAAAKRRPKLPPMATPSLEFLPQSSTAGKEILKALEQKAECDFTEQSLLEVVEFLRERHSLQVVVDQRAMTDESIALDAKDVTLRVSDISLRSMLKLILEAKDLTAVVEDEVLKITTNVKAETTMLTRTYPVRDLASNQDDDYALLMSAIQSTTGGSDQGWEVNGGSGTISMLPATGCLVIRANAHTHDEILELLQALRQANAEVQPKQ